MTKPFHLIEASAKAVPIIVSVPHSGTDFPPELEHDFLTEMRIRADDTDWFVHQLYNFVPDMGISLIHSRYCRWVIDLNRDPESKPLYDDGRIITGLTPHSDFHGNEIYVSQDHYPNEEEINRRLALYYWPYYQKLEELLTERKAEFGQVLLWDAHSIRQFVPGIRKAHFPDLILGSNDRQSAKQGLIDIAMHNLDGFGFDLKHNDPFKGGHITRYFGNPGENVHALQLEMVKKLYMDDNERIYDEQSAKKIKEMLKQVFEGLLGYLN